MKKALRAAACGAVLACGVWVGTGSSASAASMTYSRSPNLFVPDALPPGPGTPQSASDMITVSDSGLITDINVTLTLRHPQTADVTIDLTDPSGTVTVRLFDRDGGVGDGLYDVTFDDAAASVPPDFLTNGSCLVSLSFKPAGNLSDFNGLQINGTWTITVTDNAYSDASDCDCDGSVVGSDCPRTLDSWSMQINYDTTIDADLQITKSDGVSVVNEGGTLNYSIVASNNGPGDVVGATVADTFPAGLACSGTCTPSGAAVCPPSNTGNISDTVDLPNGASATYAVACTVGAGVADTILNTATITAPAGVSDSDTGNNSASDATALNHAPVAQCTDRSVSANGSCMANANIDDGSSDSDGDSLTLTQNPAGPYALGGTLVTLTAEDPGGLSDSCTATVTVVDDSDPVVSCNSPATIVPANAPISFTATASDNCSVSDVSITEYRCFATNGSGKIIDKRESCVVSISGATITIQNSGGVDTMITWSVSASDASENESSANCSVHVAHP